MIKSLLANNIIMMALLLPFFLCFSFPLFTIHATMIIMINPSKIKHSPPAIEDNIMIHMTSVSRLPG